MTITKRVLNDLRQGGLMTTAQIRKNYRSKNPTALIARLRKQGHPIYTQDETLNNNHTYTMYKYGHPPKEVLQAGYIVFGATIYRR